MPEDRRLVLASSNTGKAREFRVLLEGSAWTLLLPSEAGLTPLDVTEGGRSYLENATLKAVTYASASGLSALADDSGIEVDALDGRPGVLSARFGGRRAPDDGARWRYMLHLLEGVPPARRGARFRAVLALALPGGLTYVREGTVEGRIAVEARGEGGFGYDPVFELPDGRTMAQLGDEKQRISHRARAMRAMMEVLNRLAAGRPG
ncbi:MAG: non-canonical purine NTP pyrophosphatase [Dehalococcoidia bacterium]|nr:non-canonical purine NTP pyrophosphatase [Dehalococcoidia bacterium]